MSRQVWIFCGLDFRQKEVGLNIWIRRGKPGMHTQIRQQKRREKDENCNWESVVGALVRGLCLLSKDHMSVMCLSNSWYGGNQIPRRRHMMLTAAIRRWLWATKTESEPDPKWACKIWLSWWRRHTLRVTSTRWTWGRTVSRDNNHRRKAKKRQTLMKAKIIQARVTPGK